jgi:hypothetical protein
MKAKRLFLILLIVGIIAASNSIQAQCSICTKTAQQLGEQPAKGLNAGIVYLMLAPMAIIGLLGYRWWKNNQNPDADE